MSFSCFRLQLCQMCPHTSMMTVLATIMTRSQDCTTTLTRSTTITRTCSSTCTGMETRKPTFLLPRSKQMQKVLPPVQSIQTRRSQPLARRRKTSPRIKQLNRYLPRLINVHMHEYNAKHNVLVYLLHYGLCFWFLVFNFSFINRLPKTWNAGQRV